MPRSKSFIIAALFAVTLLFSFCFLAPTMSAQQLRPERTIEEIKTEAISRAENGQYPCIGLHPEDLREAFAHIKTRDRDEWAAAFIAVGDRYMAEGESLEKTDPAKADADYIRAWHIYSFGRWPVPRPPANSAPTKKRSWRFAPTRNSGILR